MTRGTARALARALLASALVGCGPPPDLLLVTFDTTRFDAPGFAGREGARTPHLDALAARGLVFRQAYASAGVTLPSHATLLTGREPFEHGVHANGRGALPEGFPTLAERLRDAGYQTGAFVAAWVLAPVFGLGRGFQRYGAETRRGGAHPLDAGVAQRPADEVADDALAWLAEADPERPLFLFVHFYDPHLPRTPHPELGAFADPYDEEIAFADRELGRVLEGLRALRPGREALVVFTSDHGEAFGAHGEATHALLAYDATLHVPLVLAGPGVPRGRSDALARHVDVVPTVLAALGLGVAPDLAGRDLVAAARNGDAEDVFGYFESRSPEATLGWAPITGIRTATLKYTAEPEPPELYDLGEDPGELHNLAARRPDDAARLAAAHRRLHRPRAPKPRPARLPDETAARLAALGYLGAPGRFDPGEAPDPRRWAAAHGLVDRARGLARAGHHDRAIAALRAVAASPALRPLALRTLAPILGEAGDPEAAIAAWRDALALGDSADAREGLASALLAAGRPGEVLEVLAEPPVTAGSAALRARARAALGQWSQARSELDGFAARRGRPDWGRRQRALLCLELGPAPDGERELRELVAAAPDDAWLGSALGFHLALWGSEGDGAEGLALLREAAAREPERAELHAQLGWGAHRRGRREEARDALERALALEPGRHQDQVRLAFVLRELGDDDRARELLRDALAVRPAATWAAAARDALAELGQGEPPRGASPDPALLEVYDALLREGGEDAALRLDRGAALLRLGRADEAAADTRRALELDPSLAEAHLNLGLLALGAGHEDEALRHLERALALRPDYPKAHLLLARILLGRGDATAADHVERALANDAHAPAPLD